MIKINSLVKLARRLAVWPLKHKKALLRLGAMGMAINLLIVTACYLIIAPNKKYILAANSDKHVRVGLVLGAGVAPNGKPYKELQARLDAAADALNNGQVERLLLSGDNRYKNYDEPTAMQNYLVNKRHIPPYKLQRDFAGRSTYESCERASKIFGLKQVIIYSAASHLPRAIYLCRTFGVEAYGVGSGLEANNSTRRELLARVKAIYNVYIRGEPTVLGEEITIN